MKVKFTEESLNHDLEGLWDCHDFIGCKSSNQADQENQGSRQENQGSRQLL